MTRDEILALPAGQKLDRLIAIHVLRLTSRGGENWVVPPYSVDARSAKLVVEEMLESGYLFRCEGDRCYFRHVIRTLDERAASIPWPADRDQQPRAICQAALLALPVGG